MYLERKAVESTLRKIARTAAGSVIAFDYFLDRIGQSSRSIFMRYAKAVINVTGEPWRVGIDNTPPVRERVSSSLLSLAASRWRSSATSGRRRRISALWPGFATAIVSSSQERLALQLNIAGPESVDAEARRYHSMRRSVFPANDQCLFCSCTRSHELTVFRPDRALACGFPPSGRAAIVGHQDGHPVSSA